jgi:hypothetical protein
MEVGDKKFTPTSISRDGRGVSALGRWHGRTLDRQGMPPKLMTLPSLHSLRKYPANAQSYRLARVVDALGNATRGALGPPWKA